MPRAQIALPNQKVMNADFIEDPTNQKQSVSAEGSKHNSYVSVPGNVRFYEIPDEKQSNFRYYILKIIGADGNQGKVKIADFGLRGGNESYAGFIKVPQGSE